MTLIRIPIIVLVFDIVLVLVLVRVLDSQGRGHNPPATLKH
jgi:hypothetical protein